MVSETLGVGIIVGNDKGTIKACIQSIADIADQIVVCIQDDTDNDTLEQIKTATNKVEIVNFGKWVDDFSAKRNYCFSFLKTDWLLWVDADDIVNNPEEIRNLMARVEPEVGAVWFPYHYAIDEYGNPFTIYERERLLRAKFGWVWRNRLHETVSPLMQCKFVRCVDVIFRHDHLAGVNRGERNFRILNLMYKEDPEDKRVWLYLGHQYFATGDFKNAAHWYLRFGADEGAIALERYQSLCYATRSLRELGDPQATEPALMAITLFPNYYDAHLEIAHCYLRVGEYDKAIHWAKLSELGEAPPALVFVNPLEYSFNKLALLAECYIHKGDLHKALQYTQETHKIRPTNEVENNIKYIQTLIARERAIDGIRVLSVDLLKNKEIVSLEHLIQSVPYWFRDTEEYERLKQGIEFYSKQETTEPQVTEPDTKSVLVNLGTIREPEEYLEETDKKYDKVTLVAPFPTEGVKQVRTYTLGDMEKLITSRQGRHIVNLQQDKNRIICEYDKNIPKDLIVRMYLGQGLEVWNPNTITEKGCGGSETSAAWICRELAKLNCQPILYAMDNQVWDGVIYRSFDKFQPENAGGHLFISSRQPYIFENDIPSAQKWLWCHDITASEGLTPDIAQKLDAIVGLSHWHIGHLQRVYPFLKDCEIIDMDDRDITYDDTWTATIFHEGSSIIRKPKLVILGDAIDTERFVTKKPVPKIKNRFIWSSSPDRGLEQLLDMWGLIKAEIPDASLHIFYGWEYYDTALHIPGYRDFKNRILEKIKQPDVVWRGRVGQVELAREFLKSEFMVYPPPHEFRETYGITFLEAQAAGIICFYRENGALGETIGDRGIPLPLDMAQEDIVKTIVSTLHNKELCARIVREGLEYASQRTWTKQAEKMLALYNLIKGG